MAPAIDVAERSIVDLKLQHPNNPVLNHHMANITIVKDTAGNRKLNKASEKKKIDGAVAMVMALSIAAREVQDIGDPDFRLESLFDDDATSTTVDMNV